jgi:exonuclease SbcD
LISFADFHLGVKSYGKLDSETGLNIREVKALETLDNMIQYAIDNNIKLIVGAGDMYKNSLPSPTLQNEFNKRIKKAADKGITVLLLDGNHDVPKVDQKSSPLKPFDTLDIPNVIHTRFHREYIYEENGEKIKFVFLPTYHNKQKIKDIIKNTEYEGFPIVYIGHITIKGALLNDWLVENKEIYIEAEEFNREGVAAAILGHLHKHQILLEDPLVFYTGSTQRIDFNEEKQPKGFIELNIKQNGDTSYDFIEVKSQKFLTLKLEYNCDGDITDDILRELDKNKDKIKNSIVRIQIKMNEGTTLQENKIYKYGYVLGALNMLGVQKEYDYQDRSRNEELTENVSVNDGLKMYYGDKERSEERIQLGKEIINEIQDQL